MATARNGARLQATIGNQAVLRLQVLGGARFDVGPKGDSLEQEPGGDRPEVPPRVRASALGQD